ncbi:MAG: peptide chain release factor-like protein [Planctomycetota bacterium]
MPFNGNSADETSDAEDRDPSPDPSASANYGNSVSSASETFVVSRELRLSLKWFDGLHPVLLEPDELLRQCSLRTQRRSGPGGQHRNKTSSGVFLTHQPTETVAEATERRSQADNRAVALQRLRLKLAVDIRTHSILDGVVNEIEHQLREKLIAGGMRLADSNPKKAPLLALLLNDLHACGGQPRQITNHWKTSSSSIIRLMRTHPPAWRILQEIRQHHGLRPLA